MDDNEAIENNLDRITNEVIKAERAYQIAMKRVAEKMDALFVARRRHRDAMYAMGYDEVVTPDFKTKWMEHMQQEDRRRLAPDDLDNSYGNPPSKVNDDVQLADESVEPPSVEEISYHFEVGRAEAAAIIAYAKAHRDDLRAVINRGWHSQG